MRFLGLILASIILFSIIGMQESFATWISQDIQTDDGVDIDGSWYLGEGLKQGDYFEYYLCEIYLNDCAPIKLKIWIKGEIPYESETLWDAKILIDDDNKKIKGSMGLGKITPEPILFDDEIFEYAIAFKHSLAWLGAFATSVEDDRIHGPKEFRDVTWSKIISIGVSPLIPIRVETITIPAGTFDTVVVGWESNNTNEIWVVDDFPFPVKALTYTWITTGVAPIRHQYTLLDYKENILEDPFIPVVIPEKSFTKENQSFISPKQQLESGITPENIICKEGLELIFKQNNSPACVKPSTAERLIERGWQSMTDLETNFHIINECKNNHGNWINEYDECVASGFTQEFCNGISCSENFENYCSEFNGKFNDCSSACRHSLEPTVVCTANCVRVCDFS